jgi:hypothetical protein
MSVVTPLPGLVARLASFLYEDAEGAPAGRALPTR